MKLPSGFSKRARKVFFFLHLWLGLVVGLWFAMMGLTGSVCAWLPELIPLEMKAKFPHQKPMADAPQISVSRAVAAMQKAHPESKPEQLAFVGTPYSRFPYYIFSMTHVSPTSFCLVDPYSGKVNPTIRVEDLWIGVVAHFHANLLLDAKGLMANGVGSLLGVVMLLSGLWLWWPSTMRQLKLRMSFKRGAPLKRRLYDLHNVMGIYLYGVIFIVTLTGALLALNGVTEEGVEKAIDRRAGIEVKPVVVKVRGARLHDDELVRRAKVANIGMTLTGVSRPTKKDAPFSAFFENPTPGFLGGSHLDLDPYTGKVLRFERDRDASPGHKVITLSNDLHFGLFGGVATKLLYTVAGILPLGLFITGVWMWWRKKARRNKNTSTELKI